MFGKYSFKIDMLVIGLTTCLSAFIFAGGGELRLGGFILFLGAIIAVIVAAIHISEPIQALPKRKKKKRGERYD